MPRRRVTERFICHYVRLKWKSDLLPISCSTPEGMHASREIDWMYLIVRCHFMTRVSGFSIRDARLHAPRNAEQK